MSTKEELIKIIQDADEEELKNISKSVRRRKAPTITDEKVVERFKTMEKDDIIGIFKVILNEAVEGNLDEEDDYYKRSRNFDRIVRQICGEYYDEYIEYCCWEDGVGYDTHDWNTGF